MMTSNEKEERQTLRDSFNGETFLIRKQYKISEILDQKTKNAFI